MKNKIERTFAALKKANRHGIMAHVVIGYPDLERSASLMNTLADSGADLIEMQIPFSDPIADGPTIMEANRKALAAGVRVADCMAFAGRMAAKLAGVPLLFMTYVNIPFNYGMEAFCRDSSSAGVCGLIVPDLPPDERAENYLGLCRNSGLHPIHILSPSSTDERMEIIGRASSGFIYCTARVGITGARESQTSGLAGFIRRVRKHTSLPLALGFGISSAEHVRSVSRLAEASVVGSKVLDLYNQASGEKQALARVGDFVRSLR